MEEMLEKTLEIEGLIRILRDGSPSEETYSLLKKKITELSTLSSALTSSSSAAVKKHSEDEAEIPQEALDQEIRDDVRMEEAESIEMKTWKKMYHSKPDDDDIILTLDEESPENVVNDARNEDAATAHNDNIQTKGTSNIKSWFSLNDRFLYSRELFDGNMKTFDSTLKSIEGVKDFTVVEDYFYNELDWDKENPTVKSFMEKLKAKIK